MNGRWVVLELDGDLNRSGFRVTLEILTANEQQSLKVKGELPSAPDMLEHLHRHWQEVYRPLGMPLRIKGQKIIYKGFINQRLADCQQSAQLLRDHFQTWLNAESFQPIDRRLREELSRDETIRFLIRTQNVDVQKLPWHEWDFFERYPHAEIALSTPEYEAVPASGRAASHHPVRILAILGHSHGINVEADQRLLAQLPQAQVSFLVEPDRQQLNDRLWEKPWDILFFAGHSETSRDQGRIFLNPTDSLTLSELRYGLRKAIDQGLQLAIFNSCDGLGLVQGLQQLGIPQMIVMREPVVDQVAEAFLRYFLEAYASGESLYLSARQARERLQGLEHQYPCASWLPVIYQNQLLPPPDWHTLQGKAVGPLPPTAALPAQKTSPLNRFQALWVSLVVTLMVLIVQHLGLLQPFELAAYDHVMRSRPAETIDSRILVVEVTQSDLNQFGGYPLSDGILAQTTDVLQQSEPVAIAFDMHRFRPRGSGRQAWLDQFQRYDNLFTVCAYGNPAQDYESPPEFSNEQQIGQVGFSNFLLDQTALSPEVSLPGVVSSASQQPGTVRRHLLSYAPELVATHSSCATPYSLSFQLAYRFLYQNGITPLNVNENDHWQFGETTFGTLPRRFGGYQNLDGLSAQLMLNYRAAQPGQAVSLQAVLTGNVKPEMIRNRLVLVGYTAPLAKDSVNTPYGEMPGVWVHSHMVSQLISAVLDQRPIIGKLPRWQNLPCWDGVWILAWGLLGGIAVSELYHRQPLPSKFGIPLGLIVIMLAFSWGLTQVAVAGMTHGIWLPLLPTIISVFLSVSYVATVNATSKTRQ